MDLKTQKFMFVTLILFVLAFDVRLFAVEQNVEQTQDFFEMSLEELTKVSVAVPAFRQAQKIGELSVPVSVITDEDIHYSGLTNISEVFQFTSGMDVLKFNRFRYAVGVRRLHDMASDRVQPLVDGWLIDNPLFGGPEYCNLPILLEDIKQIEIIKGPGGAACGANDFTGVINIITKEPEDVLGWFGSGSITEFGDTYTHLRWVEKQNNWRCRSSLCYEDHKSSDDLLDGSASYKSFQPLLNGLMNFGSFTARRMQLNF